MASGCSRTRTARACASSAATAATTRGAWYNLRAMTDRDVKAIYAYLKHLGPVGQPASQCVPADKTPAGPFVQFPAPPK